MDARGCAVAFGATSAASTKTTTVDEAMPTKTAAAQNCCVSSRPSTAIAPAAERVSARFFGFAPDRTAPAASDLAGVKASTLLTQAGSAAGSPLRGRFRH